MSDVSILLQSIESGDKQAATKLLPLVYQELRRLAAHELRSERPDHTLQPTALVHEAFVRLVGNEDELKWNHRGHFYGAAAKAMRQILVESARRKRALKRGGDGERIPLSDEIVVESERHPNLLVLDAALDRLAVERPDLVDLVSLRFFAGLTMQQSASALGIPKRTAERNWTYAKAWLRQAIRSESP